MDNVNEFQKHVIHVVYKYAKVKENETIAELRKENEVLYNANQDMKKYLYHCHQEHVYLCVNCGGTMYEKFGPPVDSLEWFSCSRNHKGKCPEFCSVCTTAASKYYNGKKQCLKGVLQGK